MHQKDEVSSRHARWSTVKQAEHPPYVASQERKPPNSAESAPISPAHFLEATLSLLAADARVGHMDKFQIEALHTQIRVATDLQEIIKICRESKSWGVAIEARAKELGDSQRRLELLGDEK
jgi:hypothetical protein